MMARAPGAGNLALPVALSTVLRRRDDDGMTQSRGIMVRAPLPLPVPRLTIDMLDDFPDDGTR